MAGKRKDYFSFGYILSVILAVIPVTSLILGIVTRIKEGALIGVIIRIFIGWNLLWLIDLISMILRQRIVRLKL